MTARDQARGPGRAGDAWEAVIGLEIHVQLATRAKLFSRAPAPAPDADRAGPPTPNHLVDPVVLGLPGALPTLNEGAVELAVRLALALGAQVQGESRFARKHYLYPDLPKGYQITQGEAPLARGGEVWVTRGGALHPVPLERLHLEEDAGKSVHDAATQRTPVDFDRAGAALAEVVTAPELRSPEEAEAAFRSVREVAVAVGATPGDLERGHLRCDANVSVRRRSAAGLGPKVEVKNLNSFRFVRRALAFEIERQIEALEGGAAVVRETRTWDDAARETRPTRGKETVQNYRYLYEPDLLPLVMDEAWVERVRASLPELPAARRRRLVARLTGHWGLDPRDAATLAKSEQEFAYFEEVARGLGGTRQDGREAAKWLLGPVRALAAQRARGPAASAARPAQPAGPPATQPDAAPAAALVALVGAARRGALTVALAKEGVAAVIEDPTLDVDAWIEAHAGRSGPREIASAAARAVADHPAEAVDYRGGKDKLLGFFMGVVMRDLGGRADPGAVREALEQILDERPPGPDRRGKGAGA